MIKVIRKLLALAVLCVPFSISGDEELLPSDQAFRFDAGITESGSIEVIWDIANGYYMYRDKMAFRFEGGNFVTAAPKLPRGKSKQDPLFGEVEVYTETVSIQIPVNAANTDNFKLIATGQGCNEPVGVCYPPMDRAVEFTRIVESESLTESGIQNDSLFSSQSDQAEFSSLESADDLRSMLAAGFDQQEFLDVDEAFKLHFASVFDTRAEAMFDIAPGYYLYKDKIKFSANISDSLSRVSLPPGKSKVDEYFGEVTVFEQDFTVPITLQNPQSTDLTITATYQGCAVDGICYSPVTKTFGLGAVLGTAVAESSGSQFHTAILSATESVSSVSSGYFNTTDQSSQIIASENEESPKSYTWLLLSALAAGLLLTFTPCVLPMIPILTSVIAGQGNQLNKVRGGMLAVIYVAGTMVTYAAMGALAGATGDQLQAYFQNIWAIGILSILFFVMALSMFGLFEIQMPAFIQTRIQTGTGSMTGTTPLVFLLGLFSALIIGACVSPVLISFLGIAVTTGNPALGSTLMVAMALGMGLPLIALGFGAGHLIPKAGIWMEKVKQAFGVMLVCVAIYLLGILPQVPVLLIWGVFFIILSRFLGKDEAFGANWNRFEAGIGIFILIWGIVLLIGAFSGQRDIFRPLPANLINPFSVTVQQHKSSESHEFINAATPADLEQILQDAVSDKKPVIVDYYADWCVDCIRMEETTFSDPDVIRVLENEFVTVQIDVTDPTNPDNRALKQRFKVFGPPATIFVDNNGNVMSELNFYGYKDAEEFLQLVSTFESI